MMLIGTLPHEEAKYDGDYNTFFQYRFFKSGLSFRSSRVDCGYENNADLVGAINVLERGHRLLACRELAQSGRSVKQEPAEATQGVAQCHA